MITDSNLVTAAWLHDHLNDENILVLDATLPKATGGSHKLEPKKAIPGARFFDINGAFSDESNDLPHMMASEEKYNRSAQRLGVSNSHILIVYDDHGIYSSPRAWWMWKAMGHHQVFVLDGGLPKWMEAGYPTVEEHTNPPTEGTFKGTLHPEFFVSSDEVLASTEDTGSVLIDARSSGRFQGTEPEPRVGLRSGHIPNSKNLPFPEVLNGSMLKNPKELKDIYDALDVEGKAINFSCGSGLTACIIALAAEEAQLPVKSKSVYDGSWSEWGKPSDLPVS